jgi:hypothetical protein
MRHFIEIFKNFTLIGVFFFSYLILFAEDNQGIDQFSNENFKGKAISLDSDNDWEYTIDDILPENIINNNFDFIKWKKYKVPSNLDSNEINSRRKIWIRRKIQIPKSLDNNNLSLRLGIISDRDKTYFNNVLIGETGCFGSPDPQGYDKIRIYEIPSSLVLKGKENTILIEVERFFPEEIGINQDRTAIGTTLQIQFDKYQEDLYKLILLSVYATVGMYFLFLFLRRRQEVENIYFALFVFTVVIYQFMRTQIKYELGLDFIFMKKIEYMAFTSLIPLFTNFIRIYFKIKISKTIILLNIFSVVIINYYLFTSDLILFDKLNKSLTQPIGFIYIGFLFYYLLASRKNKDSAYILFGVVMIFISVVVDILSDRGYFQMPRTFGYSFIFFILSIAVILANKFVRLHAEVEELNTSLESKVELRTRELHESMQEIQKIKTQQDGDYFLTSLLLSPLTANKNKSEYVKTEFYSKQKKTFHFKNKTYEIGGDISISANIVLNDKKYTVFINGDAMGKSIQGAGGALVMGVVFNTVLSRSNIASFKTKTPEKWLKDAFLELQRIFESFDGTMFLSCVMGLIDDETGFLYHINAEHPWTVLYREGKASFIEERFTTRKLGIYENEKLFQVQTMNLKPGDILILGSDGRDDIQIGVSESIRIINEDETLFLETVQKANANLPVIVDLLHQTGELTDDCSLLRIEYKGPLVNQNKSNFTEILSRMFKTHYDVKEDNGAENIHLLKNIYKLYPYNEVVNRQLGFFYFKKREFQSAIKHINQYTYKKPESTEMLYLASISNKKCGNYEKAVDIGEQILLREPKNFKNLKNLKELYRLTRKIEREQELEARIKELKK